MASTLAASPGSPYAKRTIVPTYGVDGFVENVGIGVKIFVTAFKQFAKYYAKYRTNIEQAAHALDSIPPVTDPPLGTKIVAALDAVFAFAPQISKLDAPGAG